MNYRKLNLYVFMLYYASCYKILRGIKLLIVVCATWAHDKANDNL